MRKLFIACIAAASLSASANAQEPGNIPGVGLMCRAYEHIDGQLAYIKAELKLTPEQEDAWAVFANVFRSDKEKEFRQCRAAEESAKEIASASLPHSMKMKAERLSEQLNDVRALEAPVQRLYSSLSKEQKKVADEIMKGAP